MTCGALDVLEDVVIEEVPVVTTPPTNSALALDQAKVVSRKALRGRRASPLGVFVDNRRTTPPRR